jgi:outer membrane protein assembly factor BamB
MSKSGLLCYNGPVSTLCCAKWERRGGIRLTTKITKESNFLLLFVFFASFVVKKLFPKKRLEKPSGFPEKFQPFFEKLFNFNVKFRKFFGFYFFEEQWSWGARPSKWFPPRRLAESPCVAVCSSNFGTGQTLTATVYTVYLLASTAFSLINAGSRFMRMNRSILVFLGLVACLRPPAASAENWPQWRGPFFNGSTTETNLPASWSKTENVLWTAPMPGPSHATPIIWDDSVFVISPDEDKNLLLLCLDRRTGKVVWKKQVGIGDRTQGRNNMASPSPVTDGKNVWAMVGTGELAAFDFSGKQLWTRNLAREYGRNGKFSIQWLYGSSPMFYKNRLYIQVLQRCPTAVQVSSAGEGQPKVESFILCLDPGSGTNIWRHVRPSDALEESQESYATPMPGECPGGTEIVVAGGDCVTGHDAGTGAELWRGGGLRNFRNITTSRLVPTPLLADGMVIVCGAKRNPLLAFHDCGNGDVTTNGLAWTYKEYPTDCVTPLFYQGKLFEMDGDRQMMVCMDPKTGKVEWQKSLGNREIYRASPTGADGKIYCFSENATAVVMSAADGQVLATINMEEGQSHATIAAAHGCLFVRTAQNLYCIGKK